LLVKSIPNDSGPPGIYGGLEKTASYPSITPDLMSISTYGPLIHKVNKYQKLAPIDAIIDALDS